MRRDEPINVSRLFIPAAAPSTAENYVFAAGCCAAAFLCRALLEPVIHDHSPLILFALAVAFSAIRGFGPGIFATFVGAIGSLYFFRPVGTFSILHYSIARELRSTATFQIVVFFIIGCILSWLGGELARLRWGAVQLAAQRNEILESITDGFEAVDRDWRFVYLNRTAAKLVRTPRSEIVGRILWEEIPEWRATVVEEKFREAFSRRAALHFEYLSPSGGRWYEFHVHPASNGGLTVYFSDVSERKLAELRLHDALAERDQALGRVHLLSGLLPICANCKRIRDEAGAWQQMEAYISQHSQAQFSHGMCPECARRYYEELEKYSRGAQGM